MDKKNQHKSRSSGNQRKLSSKKNQIIERNQKKSNKRTGSLKGIGKE